MSLVPRDHAVEAIHTAVEQALFQKMTSRQFIQAAAISWEQALNDDKETARRDFNKALQV